MNIADLQREVGLKKEIYPRNVYGLSMGFAAGWMNSFQHNMQSRLPSKKKHLKLDIPSHAKSNSFVLKHRGYFHK